MVLQGAIFLIAWSLPLVSGQGSQRDGRAAVSIDYNDFRRIARDHPDQSDATFFI
jgi:hypothetical protein